MTDRAIDWIVVDPDLDSADKGARQWSVLLGAEPRPFSGPATFEAWLASSKVPAAAAVLMHLSPAGAWKLYETSIASNSASSSWIWIRVGGTPPAASDAASFRSKRFYCRQITVGAPTDLGFQACWKRFVEQLDLAAPDFSPLDPTGIPGALLAWLLREKFKNSVPEVPEVPEADVKVAYNELWDATAQRSRGDARRLTEGVPTVEHAAGLIRAARVDLSV